MHSLQSKRPTSCGGLVVCEHISMPKQVGTAFLFVIQNGDLLLNFIGQLQFPAISTHNNPTFWGQSLSFIML